VTLLRVLAVLVGSLCLVLAGSWFVADRVATRFVVGELESRGLAGLLELGEVRLPRPDLGRASDVSLRDPLTGEVVAHVDRVDLRFDLPGPGAWTRARTDRIVGHGGRVMLSREAGELGFVRAIQDAIVRYREWMQRTADGDGGEAGHAPTLEFRQVEVVLRSPGLPLETVPGCTAWINPLQGGVQVLIQTGPMGGLVSLRFGSDGLEQLRVTGVQVSPIHALFLPEVGELLGSELRPEGRLELTVTRVAESDYRAEGILHDATLRPPRVPFPLERAHLPFEYADGGFSVDEASLSFDGGEVSTTITSRTESGLTVTLDAVDVRFRSDYLDLFPQSRDLSWLRVEDGGNVELHLQVHRPLEGDIDVRGWGGLLVRRAWVGPTGVEVEDVVGSFDVVGQEVVFRETSGICSGGVVRMRGRLDARSGEVEFTGSVFDVDLAHVRRQLAPGSEPRRNLSGWLQGDVHYTGVIGRPETGTGEGSLSIRGGDLWQVPVLDAVRVALGRGEPETSESDRLTVVFRVKRGDFRVDDARVTSPFLSLTGSGRIQRSGEIDAEIIPISVELGMLSSLFEYFQRQIVKVEVGGVVGEPEVRVIPVKAVTGNVSRLWSWLAGLFSSDDDPPPGAP
jgi:hypothetical protein